jgi:hypothetical protein
VFKNENSQSPKYAVTLSHLKATVKEEGRGLSTHGYTTVNLETVLGDVEYTVKFHTDGHLVVATTFADVVTQQAATGEADEVRKVSQRSCSLKTIIRVSFWLIHFSNYSRNWAIAIFRRNGALSPTRNQLR